MNNLEDWRNQIDLIDNIILETIAKRMEISRRIGTYKAKRSIPILQPERYERMMIDRQRHASELNLDHNFVQQLFDLIHEESRNAQKCQKNNL